ncbi:helix-turn-helix domain-containing protein [Deinococcus sp. NW-56]|uniref:helix-turn-helix domain-containing protein n=1 Tax=Deinococcus sp. NW-56 TaxID=2080419 RepID=UPI00131A04BF|nr:helix-turn-helix transcriptional regulator [Deinococcus sp. NW-56]
MAGTETEVRRWLTDTREDLGLTQTEVDRRTRELGPKFRVSQSYLSQIESGTRPFTDLGPERMDALRRVYRISAEEWVRRTGVSLMTPDALEHPGGGESAPPPPLFPEYEVPPALQEAIELYGDKFPRLRSESVRRNLSLARYYEGSGPQTAADWLSYYLSIAKWIED